MIVRSAAAFLALCLLPPGAAARGALAFPHGTLRVHQRGAATVLSITEGNHVARLALPPEDGIFAGSYDGQPGDLQLVGTIPHRVLILSIDYASRPNGGSAQCGAGTETMLRVIALRPVPRQTFHQLVQSCWLNIEEGDIGWDGATRQLTVERTTYDPDTEHRRTRYRVRPDGALDLLKVDNLP